MQERGCVTGGQSLPPCHRRFCGLSRGHFVFFAVVVLTVFVSFRLDITEMSSDWRSKWLTHYGIKAWGTPFRPPEPAPDRLQNKSLSSEPITPPPYKSPGPYLVEYPYKYHFTINQPYTCENYKPFLVLVVPVVPNNRAHRDIIRSTWGGESLVLGKVVQLFFMLGQQSGVGVEELQEKLLEESKEYGDLIQSNFVDCYKNLTIKTMVMMEWLDTYCSGTPYAMKIDSDMFLNVPNLIRMLLKAPKTNYLTGLVARGGVVLRNPKSKWYVPASLYPAAYYPRYALGLGYVFTLDLAKKLVEASKHVLSIYIEDVHLGLCMQHLRIPPTDPPGWLFHVFPVRYSRCAFSKLIATTTTKQFDRSWAWMDFKKPGPYC
ncbi:beta-1,3-galactosyltransferase 1-like [Halichoeres trimaculatus]|uniref:beta-1,3-galactosyltransferase 1-like n=1 Tax=Halichoeres trimaculatus TaxID=147232 RepID=UPI003D9DF362